MDHLSNLLSNIQMGLVRGSLYIKSANTKYIRRILELLIEEGMIRGFREEGNEIYVYLKYFEGKPIIRSLKRISKPSKRVYRNKKELMSKVMKGDIFIYTTSEGINSSTKLLREGSKHGGELLFEIKLYF